MKANLTFNLPNDLFKLFQLYAESPTFRDLLGFDGIRTQQVKEFVTWIIENKYEYDFLSWVKNVLDKKDGRFSNETNLQKQFINLGNNIAEVTKSVKEYFETFGDSSEALESPIFFIEKLNKESNCDDWDVLTVDRANRRALVLCRDAISMDYSLIKKTKEYKWSESEINKYLNTEFIKLLHEENIASVKHETNGEITNEKIFLLSKDEVNRYLPHVPGYIPYSTRIAKMRNENYEFVPVNWSLRDLNPVKSNKYIGASVYFVSTEGKICDSYYGEFSLGLRPALWVKY